MRKIIITCFLFAGISFTMNAQEKLSIDITKSHLNWEGYYTFYFGGHEGYINLKEGHFIKTGNKITSGEFVIDMSSITGTDNGKIDKDSGLIKHLKDPDFFDVEKYHEAKLIITNVNYESATRMKIEANLTIKGVTKSINFRAEVDFEKKQLTTKFKIDRMRWGINYNSKLRDGAISDAIGFDVTLSL